ncbi:hypothetical protein [Sphingomonas sp.]
MHIAPLKNDRWRAGRNRPSRSRPVAMLAALLLLSLVFLISLIVLLVEFT